MKKALGYFIGICLLVITTGAQTQLPCPPCYSDSQMLPGHGTTAGGRRILNVYVEPQGWDSSAIYQRIVDAVDRSTTGTFGWDNARGVDINTTIPYYFQRTNDPSQADITVQRGLAKFGCAEGRPSTDETRYIINMDSATQNLSDHEIDLTLEHEFGHPIGLDDNLDCYTIMGASNDDGSCTASELAQAIQASDVDRVNQNFSSQSTCTNSVSGGGGDRYIDQPESHYSCGGGYWYITEHYLCDVYTWQCDFWYRDPPVYVGPYCYQ